MGSMRLLPLLAVATALLAACGGSGTAVCVELREPQDPASGLHVLEAGVIEYTTDPPTSGPHIAGPTPSGPLAAPLDPAIQVRLLEGGGVMIQYADLAPAGIAELEAFGGDRVVVAPSDGDLADPIVVTAWTWKLSCGSVDGEAIQRFIDRRPADAPGFD